MSTIPYDPAVIPSYTTKEDDVDLVEADHMNQVQIDVKGLKEEIGISVAGTETDLKTRLSRVIADNGALKQGTSFPSSPYTGQGFYRTDQNVYYIYNGSTWDSLGQSLSNVAWFWNGHDEAASDTHGLFVLDGKNNESGQTLLPDISNASNDGHNMFIDTYGSTFRNHFRFKYFKKAGVGTVTIHARLWSSDSGASSEAVLNVDIGGQSNTVQSTTSTTPSWVTTATIDISSLSDDTLYEGVIQLRSEGSSTSAFCSAITLINS